jgi:hypothetical protein
MGKPEENQSVRCTRVRDREILGDYYRDLANNYGHYVPHTKKDGTVTAPALQWPFHPDISEYENL